MTNVKHKPAARAPTPELDSRRALQNPVRRRGDAQDIANAVLFLVSDLASFTSTESVAINDRMPTKHPASIAARLTGLEV